MYGSTDDRYGPPSGPSSGQFGAGQVGPDGRPIGQVRLLHESHFLKRHESHSF